MPIVAAQARELTVLGAASLTEALRRIAADFEAAGGPAVRVSVASSSTVARQVEAGAPADVIALASEPWMDHLEARGLVASGTRRSVIGNRLVLIAPVDEDGQARPRPDLELDAGVALAALLGPGGRLALGDPAHVPAGVYARHALESLGQWAELESRLAPAAHVRAALALVARGEAPLGIVYATDASVSPEVRVVGRFPAWSHPEITYPFAVAAGHAGDWTLRLYAHMIGEAGLAVFETYGFERRAKDR